MITYKTRKAARHENCSGYVPPRSGNLSGFRCWSFPVGLNVILRIGRGWSFWSIWLGVPLLLIFCWPGVSSPKGICASLKKVRFFSNAGHTRVVLDLDRKVDYEAHRLSGNQRAKKPPRIFVDLFNTRCASDLPRKIDLDNGLVQSIRTAPNNVNKSRIVLDLRKVEQYKIFSLDHPYRIVMDLWLNEKEKAGIKKKSSQEGAAERFSAKIRERRKPIIVLDPGHGGKDPGAVSKRGLKEKDVVFSIAKYAQDILVKENRVRVVLTRDCDKFVRLERRTFIANSQNADLFVSIHVNAFPTSDFRGVETFYLDNTTDKAAIRLAALENATVKGKTGDLQGILLTLRQNANAWESYTLAHTVQKNLIGGFNRNGYRDVPDLGVKGNLFYVLIGARMPSILVEVSFLTNALDERRLKTSVYQKAIAQGIVEGVMNYLEQGDFSTLLAQH